MGNEEQARHELEQLMLTDPLTGVGNRRLLRLRLADEILRADRFRRGLTAVFFDLDHFKRINDSYGHDVGDAVLIQVAASLGANLRQSDLVARYGGEEFVILLAETRLDEALTLVERMRNAVAELKIPGLPGRITLSAGLAQWREDEHGDALLRRADQALYRAKEAGRNRSCVDRDNGHPTTQETP
jgi:diguanylate cyclase (GGDEF)-like protein